MPPPYTFTHSAHRRPAPPPAPWPDVSTVVNSRIGGVFEHYAGRNHISIGEDSVASPGIALGAAATGYDSVAVGGAFGSFASKDHGLVSIGQSERSNGNPDEIELIIPGRVAALYGFCITLSSPHGGVYGHTARCRMYFDDTFENRGEAYRMLRDFEYWHPLFSHEDRALMNAAYARIEHEPKERSAPL